MTSDKFDVDLDPALIPSFWEFLVFRYVNKTHKATSVFKCLHETCLAKVDQRDLYFPKFHNFIDHLRIHNNDRPFKCHVCTKSFS